jgi:hypothetical protein
MPPSINDESSHALIVFESICHFENEKGGAVSAMKKRAREARTRYLFLSLDPNFLE